MVDSNPQPAPRSRAAETLKPGALRFPGPTDETVAANPASTQTMPLVQSPSFRRRMVKYAAAVVGLSLFTYLMLAYLILPYAWRSYMRRHPALQGSERSTKNQDGVLADPLNVALIGTKDDIIAIMGSANWCPADDITLKSCLKITRCTLFNKEYQTAPVSTLMLYNRKQDLAFQHPGKNSRQRHHVRFWESPDKDDEGRPMWIGAATFDDGVGMTYTTLQVTHHIDANIDAERDKLFADLEATGFLKVATLLDDFHDHREGRNGGGHKYRTDGRLALGLVIFGEE